MPFNVNVLNASGKLTKIEPKIRNLIAESEKILAQHINCSELTTDLVIQHGTFVILEMGIGAYCYGQYQIDITIDTNNANLMNDFEEKFKLTLAHETHNACHHSTVGFGEKLIDSIVMEGLACRFEEEIGGRAPIYANHLSDDERQLWVSKSKSELLDKNYSHQDWFFEYA